MIKSDVLTWPEFIEKLTINPARILGIDRGTLKPGAVADVTIIDPQGDHTSTSTCSDAGRRYLRTATSLSRDNEFAVPWPLTWA
ncbi:MAG TPA: amidohydrolase family protein [Gemmataceae bacterium]